MRIRLSNLGRRIAVKKFVTSSMLAIVIVATSLVVLVSVAALMKVCLTYLAG